MIDPSFLRKRKPKWRYPLSSVVLHLLIAILFILEIHYRREMIKDEMKRILQVKPITQAELDRIIKQQKVVETDIPNAEQRDIERGQKAALGERTQRVKKETQTRNRGTLFGADQTMHYSKENASKVRERKDGLGRRLLPAEQSKLARGTYQEIDPNMSVSASTLLNTDQFIYASFSNRMRDAIGNYWYSKWLDIAEKKKKELQIGIYLTETKISLDPQGNVTHVTVDRSAGIPELDKAAVDSIMEAKSFPNPPPYLFKDPINGQIDFSFVITLVPGNAFNFNFLPDERLDRQ